MDALKRARAFLRERAEITAENDTAGGKSGESGIRAAEGRDIPLLPLLPPTVREHCNLPDHPRYHDRALWTPTQRANYCDGCVLALRVLRGRLVRGLTILSQHPTLAAEVRWFRLASRATRIIGRMARASPEAERDFLCSETGSWYTGLVWPEPSPAARRAEW